MRKDYATSVELVKILKEQLKKAKQEQQARLRKLKSANSSCKVEQFVDPFSMEVYPPAPVIGTVPTLPSPPHPVIDFTIPVVVPGSKTKRS